MRSQLLEIYGVTHFWDFEGKTFFGKYGHIDIGILGMQVSKE